MKLYVLPPSPRAFKVIALNNHLGLGCDMQVVDLGKDQHLTPEFAALNPNRKMPVLDDDGFRLWESNAILFYLAAKKPESGLWPAALRDQADVLRWLSWESAHWDAQACGAIGFERGSKMVLRLGPPDPAQIERGEREFHRYAKVLNGHLNGRKWLVGETVTIADFSIGAWLTVAKPLKLPITEYTEILRWYGRLAALPAWEASISRPGA
ncbi:MAG TPA: glutathione S-transferase family protein [Candidatus Binataceae bacterium]|nr:glutathione S-transferase family protein [Candidatus Binataceae bacterium]